MSEHEPDILVPLDGSSNAENAIPAAAAMQSLFGGRVRFVHVAEHDTGLLHTDEKAREAFRRYTDEVGQRHGVGAWSADLLPPEQPARRILAETAQSRFIVIATHGRSGFKATVIGSVADKVIRGSDVPVLVVPGIGGPAPLFKMRSIMVALDGSEAAEAGLDIARDIARRAEAGVVLVRAHRVSFPVAIEFSYYPSELADTYHQEAEAYLKTVARDGERQIVLQGVPPDVIAQAAVDGRPDILVMGTRGKGLADRLVLGSTTDRVLHSLHSPILVVPAREA